MHSSRRLTDVAIYSEKSRYLITVYVYPVRKGPYFETTGMSLVFNLKMVQI